MHPPIVLTIAGSDSSGGAGIQTDLKTFAAHGCYGTSAITALTAQNTRGVTAVHTPPAAFLAAQLDAVLTDFAPKAIKIGMLPDAACVQTAAKSLRNLDTPIVLDPVMIATSGAELSKSEAVTVMRRELFPLAALITPNIPEAEALTGMTIRGAEDMTAAAQVLCRECRAVLLKGGHLADRADDLLLIAGHEPLWLRAERLACGDTHGTGCTLSSAIACRLAQGHDLPESVGLAKDWLTNQLKNKPNFGVPNGPLHF